MSDGAGECSGRATGVEPGALSALLQEVAAAPEMREVEPVSLPPGAVIGRFEVVRELGRGGFGVVYEARDRDLGRQVAVKVVRPGRIAEATGNVLREAEAIARLNHPNLVTLHDVGRSEAGPYLVFEFLRGKTLQERLDAGPMSVQEAVHVATEVARGLAHAHAEGVVHRDLKPSNVFVTNKGAVKILDFGMAHAFGCRRLGGGTPAYMAPEQWEGEPEDERTDVFALGVMLYRMLTGEYPFPEGVGRWAAESAPPRKIDTPGAPELADLVEKMFHRRPKGRPRDGAAVLAAVAPIEDRIRTKPADGRPPEYAKRRKATLGDLLAELRRRHVFRVMIGYGVFAVAVLEATEPVRRGAHLPEWVPTAVRILLSLGVPVAVVLAWVYDLTARGVKRTPSTTDPRAPRFASSRLLLPLAVSAAVLAVAWAGAGGWHAWKRAGDPPSPSAVPGATSSIAVLPFRDLSPNHDQEYFSDGMADEILTALSKVKGLRVPGRTSSFYFKGKNVEPAEVAEKLRVTHLLEGTVRRSGNKLRISAEVVRVSDGERIWGQSFDRDVSDVFAIQDEISRHVVEALRVALVPGPPTAAIEYRPADQGAYQSYLLGKHLAGSFSVHFNRRAIEVFRKAVELDPGYPQAWAALAVATLQSGTFGASFAEARRDARAAAARAVELSPALPEALAARAQSRLADWDWSGAKADIDRALEVNPENASAIDAMIGFLAWMGRPADAAAWTLRLVEKEPLSSAVWNRLAVSYWHAGRLEDAERSFLRASEIDPAATISRNTAMFLATTGRPAEALPLCDHPYCMAVIHAYLGNVEESNGALERLLEGTGGDTAFAAAVVHSVRGEPDRAFQWLERARAEHARALNRVKSTTTFRPLHPDPRWAELLRKMGLPVD